MSSFSNKIFVLGLDGCTWQLLDPLIDEGIMPNLKKVVLNGVRGVLESTLPPYTAPAWVSCVTGVNPGKHGIYGFTLKKRGVVEGEFVDSTQIRVPKVWEYVNKAGLTVGLINVPVTYPVEPLDGFIVPCFLTPLGKEDYSYPQSIYRDFLVPNNYIINVRLAKVQEFSEATVAKTIDDLKNMTANRYRVMEALKDAYDPDFFMIVFQSIDKIQHKFWKYIDPNDPLSETSSARKIRPLLLRVYRQIDDIIGTIIDRLDRDTTLYLVSDHGFGSQRRNFFLNKWLAANGFLTIRKSELVVFRLFSRYFRNAKFFKRNVDILDHPIYRFIDFEKSEFIGSDPYEQGIYYLGDPADNNYFERISLLKNKLSMLTDPDTGESMFEKVYHRRELYRGDYIDHAPDIVLKQRNPSYNLTRGFPLKNMFFSDILNASGCHQPEGIFAAYGRNIKAGKTINADITDITPTILFNMGLPVSKLFDGVVHKDIFTKEFQTACSIVRPNKDQIMTKAPVQQVSYSCDEKEEIAARLKDLGYFD